MSRAIPLLALLVALSGCGEGSSRTQRDPAERTPAPAEDAAEDAASRLDRLIEQTNDALTAAADRGDRGEVQRLERELDRLARRDQAEGGQAEQPSSDPFERVLARIPFKRSPLFVQQITSTSDDHELFVGVEQVVFCLRSQPERQRAAEAVYLREDRFLRARKIRDFRFVLVPVNAGVPSTSKALAVGAGGRLRLTSRGRGCG